MGSSWKTASFFYRKINKNIYNRPMKKTILLVRHVEWKKTNQWRAPNQNSFSQLMDLKDSLKGLEIQSIISSSRRACSYTTEQLFPWREIVIDDRLWTDVLMKQYHRRRSGLNIYPLASWTEEQFVELFETSLWPNKEVLKEVIDELGEWTTVIMTHGWVLMSYLQEYWNVSYSEVIERIPCGSVHQLSFS